MIRLQIPLDARESPAGLICDIAAVCRRYPGNDEIDILMDTSLGPKTYRLKASVDAWDPNLYDELAALIGHPPLPL